MLTSLLFMAAAHSSEPNPPQWPNTIKINPSQSEIEEIFDKMGPELGGHFLPDRYAWFFTPGQHEVDVKLPYYTTVVGVGETRDGVKIKNLYVADGSPGAGALNNFWRGAENFEVTNPSGFREPREAYNDTVVFAVSQASPMRNIKVNGKLWFFELETDGPTDWKGGMASGGYLANVEASQPITLGSQQQFFLRNSKIPAESQAAVFNTVSLGCEGELVKTKVDSSLIHLDETPQIAEKPYIFKRDEKYFIRVPKLLSNARGTTTTDGEDIPFENVYMATAANDDANSIQSKINSSEIKAIYFTPGNYNIAKTLTVEKDNFVILGHQAFLQQPIDGTSTLKIRGNGNRVAGLTFEARSPKSARFEEPMFYVTGTGSENNPTVLSDIFSRIGRFYNLQTPMPEQPQVKASVSLQIDQDFVIVDHMWLWKADHEGWLDPEETKLHWYQTKRDDNISKHGLVVKGKGVKVYGAFSEHHDLEDVLWDGEDGLCVFLQNEWAYQQNQSDVDQKQAAYHVTENARGHKAHGLGSYTNFVTEVTQAKVGLKFDIGDPNQLNGGLVWPLNGKDGSGIKYIAQFGQTLVGKAALKNGETFPTYWPDPECRACPHCHLRAMQAKSISNTSSQSRGVQDSVEFAAVEESQTDDKDGYTVVSEANVRKY